MQTRKQNTKQDLDPKTVRDTFWTNKDEGSVQNPPLYFQNIDLDFETRGEF